MTSTAPPPIDEAKANAELQRCAAAIQQAGKAGQFPARDQWRVGLSANYGVVHVIGVRSGAKVFFCETTYTSVTVSDPNAAPTHVPNSSTAALLNSRLGTTAGVMDPSWPWPWVEYPDNVTAPTDNVHPLWVVHGGGKVNTPTRIAETDPQQADVEWKALPAAPPPAVSVVDRPAQTPPDRTSDRGGKLDECVKAADQSVGVLDVESWRPGAVLDIGGNRVALARNDYGFATCWLIDGRPYFSGYLEGPHKSDEATMPMPLGSTMNVGGSFVASGVVPQATKRMEVDGGNGAQVNLDVYDGTFAVVLQDHSKEPTAKLYDANNQMIFHGQLTN